MCRSRDREHRTREDSSRHESRRHESDRRRSSREDQPAPEISGKPNEDNADAAEAVQEQQAGQDLQVRA